MKKYPNGLSPYEALIIFRQIIKGYERIRNKNIIHRDLKPDNILFKIKP
jgi:serine/threonine protein kinase